MIKNLRRWQPLVGCAAAAATAAVGFSGAFCGVAAADPVQPAPPGPGYQPATAPGPAYQPVTVSPPAAAAGAPVPRTAPGPADIAPGPAAVTPPGPSAPAGQAAPPSGLVPATSGTLRDYFAEKGVLLEPQNPAELTALNITLPMPPGWTRVPDPNVPDAFAVIADRGSGSLYTPNAQVVVYRLVGHFDPAEAITHGFVDSQRQFAWWTTNASLADYGGFPSSIIEGTYRQDDMTLNTSQRNVIASTGGNSYLVTLTVTTGAGRSVGHAPATDAIVNGFRVTVPGSAPAAPAAPAPPAEASGPAPGPTAPLPPTGASVGPRG